jgi:ATP-dependent RNA helicase RhlB
MSDSPKHLTNTPFSSLEINPKVIDGLNKAGYEYCTPVQEKSLPISLQGKDLMAQAQTGTGKTLAFLVATFHYLLKHPVDTGGKKQPRALVLAPSRELAIQIHKDAIAIGEDLFSITAVYGGTDYEKQRKAI